MVPGAAGSNVMRIICPSCLAEYEVDDAAIPQSGRDVQCSNCGHAWFQPGPAQPPRDDTDTGPEPGPDPAEPEPGVAVSGSAGPDDPARNDPATAGPDDAAEAEADPETDADPEADDESPSPDLPRRQIDEAVLRVLREEAEREARARRAEAGLIETQPELGLEQVPPPRPERPRRQIIGESAPARPRPPKRERAATRDRRSATGTTDSPPEALSEAPTTGRARLPDIEDVSPTLPGSAGAGDDGTGFELEEVRRRGRFRAGFLGMLVLAAFALLIYALAPQIVTLVPAAEPALSAYAGAMDRAWLWMSATIDAAMRAILERLT